MNMKSLNKYQNVFNNESFDLDHEANMVQSRILSTLLEVIEDKGLTQADLEELTGLKQPFISAIFNNRKNLNMEHIALFQKALDIVLQPPSYLTKSQHANRFYDENDYEDLKVQLFEIACHHSMNNILHRYTSDSDRKVWVVAKKGARTNVNSRAWQQELNKYTMNIENH